MLVLIPKLIDRQGHLCRFWRGCLDGAFFFIASDLDIWRPMVSSTQAIGMDTTQHILNVTLISAIFVVFRVLLWTVFLWKKG